MKKILVLLLTCALASPLLHAEEKNKGSSPAGFWDALRKKLETIVPQKKQVATTATGGVRGSQVTSADVYWKGSEDLHEMDADELSAFRKGIDWVNAGDMEQAQTAFTEFVSNYPGSQLRKDADQALAALQSQQ